MTRRGILKPANWPSGDSGTYCLTLLLPRELAVRAGRLDRVTVASGLVLYVGRARRNMFARLARHMRRRKPRRWHIDYLFPTAVPLGAFVFDGEPFPECEIADRLARRATVRCIIPGFGASDCRCAGHLLWSAVLARQLRDADVQRGNVIPPFHLAGARFFPAAGW
jgi:Uri superfamily endonuclease